MTNEERAALLAKAEAADTDTWYEAADLEAALSFGMAEDPAFIAAMSPAKAKALLAALAAAEADRDAAHHGWLYFNEDAGLEWSLQHPVSSGECPDAESVRPATAEAAVAEMMSAWKALMEQDEHITAERDAARAEAARLGELVEAAYREAYRDGLNDGQQWLSPAPGEGAAWDRSEARAALAPATPGDAA